MITCPNCNKQLEDGTKFCDNCGQKIEEVVSAPEAPETPAAPQAPATVFCSNCGQQTSAESAFCQNCGASLNGEQPAAPAPKKKNPKTKTIITIAACVAAVAVVAVLLITLLGGGSAKLNYALYVKDGEMMMSKLPGGKPWQVTKSLSDDDEVSYYPSYVIFSKDGKKMFYMDKNKGYSGTLYCRYVNSPKKDPIKIDSDFSDFNINEAGNLITYTKEGNLYQHNLKDKEKLAEDVSSIWVSTDGKTIYYRDTDDTLFRMQSGKEKKIASDVSTIEHISDDFKTVYYTKDDNLYKSVNGKDPEKLISDISEVLAVYDSDEAYFVTEDDGDYSLCYFDGKKDEVLSEEYNYQASSSKAPVLLYSEDEDYFIAVKGKTSSVDMEEATGFRFNEDGSVLYYFSDVDDYHGNLYMMAISGGKAKKADLYDEEVYIYSLSLVDDQLIYFKNYDDEDDTGELYLNQKKVEEDVDYYSDRYDRQSKTLNYKLDDGTLKQYKNGKSSKIDEDAGDYAVLPNGNVLFLKDVSEKTGKGDLYLYSGSKNAKKLDEDVTDIVSYYSWETIYGD